MTTKNIYKIQTSTSLEVFEPSVLVSERHQKRGFHRAATGISWQNDKTVSKWCGENVEAVNILLVVYW